MRIEQLRFLCEVNDQGFSISKAASALHISQPAISTQLRLLEQEVGSEILLRRGGRIVGLTEPGTVALSIARRITKEVESLRNIGNEFADETTGRLCIATTHINARYVLIGVIDRFRRKYPGIQVIIRLGDPRGIREFVLSGEADIGIASMPTDGFKGLDVFPSYTLHRAVIVPANHALLAKKRLTLKDIAPYPIITMDNSFAGAGAVLQAFLRKGIKPNVVMTATDAAVIKAYVSLGLGITVLPRVAFEPQAERGLRAIDAAHLFEPTRIFICVQPTTHVRRYMHDFFTMVSGNAAP